MLDKCKVRYCKVCCCIIIILHRHNDKYHYSMWLPNLCVFTACDKTLHLANNNLFTTGEI